MKSILLSEYLALPSSARGVWTTERPDDPSWEEKREKYMGKRTISVYSEKGTSLLVEGIGFEMIDDSQEYNSAKVCKRIDTLYQFFCEEYGKEPDIAECEVYYPEVGEIYTEFVALSCDSAEEEDDNISWYCNGVESLKKCTEMLGNGGVVINCFDFYEKNIA